MSNLPFFKESPIERFTPKEIKFSKLYKRNTQGAKLGDNILINVKSTLRQSGYTDEQIARIITADKPVPVKQMKDIAATLNRANIYGFEKDQNLAVKRYLNAERVKAQSIAQIRKEHILEATEENLAKAGTTSLNQKAIGPNSLKPGQASVLARRHGTTAAYSIAAKAGSKKTTSFLSHSGETSIARPGLGRAGSTGKGVSLKPKF